MALEREGCRDVDRVRRAADCGRPHFRKGRHCSGRGRASPADSSAVLACGLQFQAGDGRLGHRHLQSLHRIDPGHRRPLRQRHLQRHAGVRLAVGPAGPHHRVELRVIHRPPRPHGPGREARPLRQVPGRPRGQGQGEGLRLRGHRAALRVRCARTQPRRDAARGCLPAGGQHVRWWHGAGAKGEQPCRRAQPQRDGHPEQPAWRNVRPCGAGRGHARKPLRRRGGRRHPSRALHQGRPHADRARTARRRRAGSAPGAVGGTRGR
mmetsp:Transcript_7743/g.30582  ORF Transcript_7743/g.30582 Transcript_7743/m.30582 type:complete len:265 (+) Transcript_7743:683-1477(+)